MKFAIPAQLAASLDAALVAVVAASLAACASGRADSGPVFVDPQALVGTWVVDLRPRPGAPDYYKEFVVTSLTEKTFTGTFYGTPIEHAHINTDWGAVRIGFDTADLSGPYHHSAVLSGGRLEGLTNSIARARLSYWSAVKP